MKRYYNADISTAVIPKTAKAMVSNAPVSQKFSTEICNCVKGQTVQWAEAFLQDIASHKRYLPLQKYNKKVGHKKGAALMGQKAGRYPKNTVRTFLKLLDNAKANADYRGLDTEKLVVFHAFSSQGFKRRSLQSKGKIGGKTRQRKSAHIEVILMETR